MELSKWIMRIATEGKIDDALQEKLGKPAKQDDYMGELPEGLRRLYSAVGDVNAELEKITQAFLVECGADKTPATTASPEAKKMYCQKASAIINKQNFLMATIDCEMRNLWPAINERMIHVAQGWKVYACNEDKRLYNNFDKLSEIFRKADCH